VGRQIWLAGRIARAQKRLLERYRQQLAVDIALLFTDIQMPGSMDGLVER
jgi:CheY-like chemotaxis protein